ncbi:MAG TPA: hypothetical protein VK651_09170, partial [Blastocatellia bacterium]|nr:hypothetical protein [Blastocatellia bacterium]
ADTHFVRSGWLMWGIWRHSRSRMVQALATTKRSPAIKEFLTPTFASGYDEMAFPDDPWRCSEAT